MLYLVKALATGLRLLDHDQARELGVGPSDLEELADLGLVRTRRVLAAPPPVLDGPVIDWQIGGPAPDVREASRFLIGRARETEERELPVVSTTHRAVRLFDGPPALNLKRRCWCPHNLGVSAVFLAYCCSSRHEGCRWIGEDYFRARCPQALGGLIPHAALIDSLGRVAAVIDFGGHHGPGRLAELYAACERAGIPYEVW
jgi:hypothetical protein